MARRVIAESEHLLAERLPLIPHSEAYAFGRLASGSAARVGKRITSRLTETQADALAAILESESEVTHGYEIAERCDRAPGSVYRALARLLELGLVEQHVEAVGIAEQEGRPARKLYSLTPAGESELAQWRAARLDRSPGARLLS